MLSAIFADLVYVIVFIDKIYIISVKFASHILHVCEVLRHLNEFKLRLNMAKCEFFKLQIAFLGYLTVSAF